MESEVKKFRVTGTVMQHGKCMGRVTKETMAISPTKAKSNAMFQVKKSMNLYGNANLSWAKDVTVTEIE